MNFYVIKIQNFCDRAKPWLGKVEALFHAIHPLLLGYEKRVCRNFDTPSFWYGSDRADERASACSQRGGLMA